MATPAQYLGTGKRKTSVARVILRPGSGATEFHDGLLRFAVGGQRVRRFSVAI